jgi:drug/metabolite transporter (DMT)-like permease
MLGSTFVSASFMSTSPQFATAGYGLAAVFAWGTSDFLGGFFTRRIDTFLFTTIFNFGGLVLMACLARTLHAPFPDARGVAWSLAAGVTGSLGVAIFFRALSTGRMGLAAPVAAVLSAAIPALFSIFTEGAPKVISVCGFALGAVGLWLITRSEDGASPQGLGLAFLAGLGFSGFYLCIRQAGPASPVWLAALARTGGLVAMAAIVLAQRNFRDITPAGFGWAVLTGCIDSVGTMFFAFSSQSGRLDEAVVISSLYPAITVLLARLVLKEHLSRWKFIGLLTALAAVPMIAAG